MKLKTIKLCAQANKDIDDSNEISNQIQSITEHLQKLKLTKNVTQQEWHILHITAVHILQQCLL